MNTAPSSAYEVAPSTVHATVVRRPSLEATARAPVFSSAKHPVPYVFLAMPG